MSNNGNGHSDQINSLIESVMGRNGGARYGMGQDESEQQGNAQQSQNPPPEQSPASPAAPKQLRSIGLDLLPFTPVPFSGPDTVWAYLRIGLYGAVSMAVWKRARTVGYVMAGAAVLSALTSLSASASARVNGR